jgi:hypothetical protein
MIEIKPRFKIQYPMKNRYKSIGFFNSLLYPKTGRYLFYSFINETIYWQYKTQKS